MPEIDDFSDVVDPFDPALFKGVVDPFAPKTDPAPVEPKGNILLDLASSFGSGSNSLLQLGGDLYGLTTGDMDNWASRQGRMGVEYWQDRKSEKLLAKEDERSTKIAEADGEFKKAGIAMWETLSSPSLLASFMFEQAPLLLATGGAGAGAATGARALSFGTGTAAKIGTGAAVGTGAVMQGTDAGGQAYENLMSIPDEVWQTNDEFQDLVGQGIPAEEAKKSISLGLSQNAAIASGVVSIGTNMLPGARILERYLANGRLPGGTLGSRIGGAVKGFAGESLQEGIEEGFGVYSGNRAASVIDTSIDPMQGVGEAAGMGAASGVFGGLAGALGAGGSVDDDTAAAQDVMSATTLDDAVAAADSALNENVEPFPRDFAIDDAPIMNQVAPEMVAFERSLGLDLGGSETGSEFRQDMVPLEIPRERTAADEAFDKMEADAQAQKEADFDLALIQRVEQDVASATRETEKQELLSRYSAENNDPNPAMGNALLAAFLKPKIAQDDRLEAIAARLESEAFAGPEAPGEIVSLRQGLSGLQSMRAEVEKELKSFEKENGRRNSLKAKVAEAGGISIREGKAEGLLDKNEQVNGKWLFTVRGDSVDGMAEKMAELGFQVLNEQGSFDKSLFMNKLDESIRGINDHAELDGMIEGNQLRDDVARIDEEIASLESALYFEIEAQNQFDAGEIEVSEDVTAASAEELATPQEAQVVDAFVSAVESGMSLEEAIESMRSYTDESNDFGAYYEFRGFAYDQEEIQNIASREADRRRESDTDREESLRAESALEEERAVERAVELSVAPAEAEPAPQVDEQDAVPAAEEAVEDSPPPDIPAGAEAAPAEEFSLDQPTPESLQERDEAAQPEEEAAEVESPEEFTLTGSDAAVDQAEARGQSNMFDAPSEEAASERLEDTPAEPEDYLDRFRREQAERSAALRGAMPDRRINTKKAENEQRKFLDGVSDEEVLRIAHRSLRLKKINGESVADVKERIIKFRAAAELTKTYRSRDLFLQGLASGKLRDTDFRDILIATRGAALANKSFSSLPKKSDKKYAKSLDRFASDALWDFGDAYDSSLAFGPLSEFRGSPYDGSEITGITRDPDLSAFTGRDSANTRMYLSDFREELSAAERLRMIDEFLAEESKAEPAAEESPAEPAAEGRPLADIMLTDEYEVDEEIVKVTDRADKMLAAIDGRIDEAKKLIACLRG